jgi:CubicO group peptidase (beta-lactamase class C family)
VVQRATGKDIRTIMHREICEPLGFRWMNFGVPARDVKRVARDAVTGIPSWRLVSPLVTHILGTTFENAVEMARDPRFLRGIIPSANVCTNAAELCDFYQCLLDEGELNGVRVFEPRTIHRATSEQAYMEIDLTLGLPIRHGLGFMLGSESVSLFGTANPRAFGHLGLTNIFSWADPDRRLSVALTTSGKPTLTPEIVRLVSLIRQIGTAFPPIGKRARSRAAKPEVQLVQKSRKSWRQRPRRTRAS